MSEISQRLRDVALQSWHNDLEKNSKLTYYVQFKTLLNVERYITELKEWKLRNALSRFRISCHSLNVEVGRRNNIDKEYRLCRYCLSKDLSYVEDEIHFLYVCKKYTHLRIKFLPELIHVHPDIYHFNRLMCTENYETIVRLSLFICEGFKEFQDD